MNYYVRATGVNRYAGGTDKWLKVRGIEPAPIGYKIEVRIQGRKKYTNIPPKGNRCENLEFGMGTWPNIQPVSYLRVIEGMI